MTTKAQTGDFAKRPEPADTPAPQPSARAAKLKAAQEAIQAGNFGEAIALAEALANSNSSDTEPLYMAAVAQRYGGSPARAQHWLDRLHAAAPEYGRAWQEQGHLARTTGDTGRAIEAFGRAVRYNPALDASWRALAELHGAAGRPAEATEAAAQASRLAGLPRELLAVTNHLHEGRIVRAKEICRHYLRRHPRDVEGMRLLAQIGSKLGILDDAEILLEAATKLQPDNIQLRLEYADVLRQRQKYARAREETEALYARDPDNALFQSRLAIDTMQTGEFGRALELFDAVLARLPDDVATLTSKGHALKTTGAQDDAVAHYRRAFDNKPDHGDAYFALANLKTYRFTDDEVTQMQDQAARGDLAFMDRVHITFALGKALEDRSDYAGSFASYDQGNALKRQQTRYSADVMSGELKRQKAACTPELFARHEGSGDPAPDPIFILGLPRAGSTLLEQILASHSQVDGTLELPNILALAHRLRGRKAGQSNYPENLGQLAAEDLAKHGAEFMESTRIHRQDAPFFIDKMPNNFRHIGLIHLILPNATIIDARRAPMDCCFSGFKQLFAEGQEFTYGLEEIGRYYADYVDLMGHWDRVLPGKVLRVQHEDVLDDLEGQVRRMLDHCGLPFEDGCVEFHRTKRAVRTALSEQVRQPINRSGQNAWAPFEPWLEPLKNALGDCAPPRGAAAE